MEKFCENCEEYIEPINGRCPYCNEMIIEKEEKVVFDEFTDNAEEFGTEDEAEEIEEVNI